MPTGRHTAAGSLLVDKLTLQNNLLPSQVEHVPVLGLSVALVDIHFRALVLTVWLRDS